MKDFLIRLLQALWVLSAAFASFLIIFGMIADQEGSLLFMIFISLVLFAGLSTVQYLMFGKLHPLSAFNGSLHKSS